MPFPGDQALGCLLGATVLVAGCSRPAPSPAAEADASVPTSSLLTQYSFVARAGDSSWRAHNAAQRFDVQFEGDGPTLVGLESAWKTSLRLVGFGRDGDMRSPRVERPRLVGDRIEYARAEGLTEWYTHGPKGLEQGFELTVRPQGSGELVLELVTDGLSPRLAPNGALVTLVDADERAVLHYGALSVVDADGHSVRATLSARNGRLSLHVADQGARYPLAVDPLVWGVQQQKLTAADALTSDELAISMGLDGDTLALAASGVASQSGAVYVFTQAVGTWTVQQKVIAPGLVAADFYGWGVGLSGDTLIATAPSGGSKVGEAFVHVRSGGTWTQQQKLVPSDGVVGDSFGISAAISGDTVVIGAQARASTTGAAYVFVRSGTTWTQQQILTASDAAPNSRFGDSVAIDGDTLVVGADESAAFLGAAYVFVRSGTTWSQQKKLVASDGLGGDNFGYAVSLSADTVVVGAPGKSINRGQSYVFVRSGTSWSEQSILKASDGASNDAFGTSVSLKGDTALIGASGKSASAGAAYVFVRAGTTWSEQKKLVAADAAGNDAFGTSVALGTSHLAVGAPQKSGFKGAAYVFVQAKANGDPCTAASECVSNFCVDSVCCDVACVGLCQACTAAKKGTGADGTCAAIGDGRDPDVECPGTTCVTATQEDGHVCNGAGACRITTTTACAPYVCDAAGKACRTACATAADCDAASFCDGTACAAKKGAGASCKGAGECSSGFCADGVCCNRACTATCEACSAAKIGSGGVDGTCALVADGLPHAACPAGTCSLGTATAYTCDGKGACKSTVISCGGVGCDVGGTACVSVCKVDGDCGLSAYCLPGGTCAPRKDKGAACAAANECKVGAFCVDGVCCAEPCDGQCEACNVDSAIGTCTAVSGAPHGKRPACSDDGKGCGGSCDPKVSSIACAYPDATKACGGGCVGSARSVCDGKGGCASPAACPGSLTCGSDGTCRDRCVVDGDCVPGFGCSGGKCTPRGTKCSDDRTSSIDSGGKATICDPILCDVPSGICGAVCNSQSDCAEGTSCNSSKQCVRDDAQPSDSGGCALGAVNGGGSPVVAALGALVALATAAARRRRRGR